MKNKIFTLTTSMIVAAGLLLSAVAQNPNNSEPRPKTPPRGSLQVEQTGPKTNPLFDIATKISLPCALTPSIGDVVKSVRVTNNSGNTIPGGTNVYVSTIQGTYKNGLGDPLANGASANLYGQPGTANSCTAWFYKK